MKCILFVIDCLRVDALPKWFIEKHRGQLHVRFMSCINTPMSFSSIFSGKHLIANSKQPILLDPFWQYKTKLPGRTIPEILMDKGIKTFFYSEEPVVLKGWWKNYVYTIEKIPKSNWIEYWVKWGDEYEIHHNLKSLLPDSYWLVYHIFKTHSPHGSYPPNYVGPWEERRKQKEIYMEKVNKAFIEVEEVIENLKPDRWAVMGDHGEEFWVEGYEGDQHERETEHGTFKRPIITNNTLFVPLLIGGEKEGISESYISYSFLKKLILDWFEFRL